MRTPRLTLVRLLNLHGRATWHRAVEWAALSRRHLTLRAHAEDGYCHYDWHGYYDDVGGSG